MNVQLFFERLPTVYGIIP